jgi:hypothetical protein
MSNAILRSTYGYGYALLVFAVLPPMADKWSLLVLTVAFVPGWWAYEVITRFIKEGRE